MRVGAGLSLRALASRMGVSAVYLGEVERGERGPMKKERWKDLMKAIPAISMEDLERHSVSTKPISLDLQNASPQYKDLAMVLARRIEQQNLSERDVKKLKSILDKKSYD